MYQTEKNAVPNPGGCQVSRDLIKMQDFAIHLETLIVL